MIFEWGGKLNGEERNKLKYVAENEQFSWNFMAWFELITVKGNKIRIGPSWYCWMKNYAKNALKHCESW